MKTLYININGESIQSSDNIIVIGRPEDAIINKFYFELGKEILKGVVAPGVSSVKKKDIVTDFKAHDERSFNSIMEQWEALKQELLGENPSGTRTINLPEEYISWLQNSSQPAYTEIAKAVYKRSGSVEVSLDKIYKNAISIIVNNIEPEECKDCGLFVVNDDAVTDDSTISISITERMPQISFLPYEDFRKSPRCGQKSCECKPDSPICPKCGKNPCECTPQESQPVLFVIYNVTKVKRTKQKAYDVVIQIINEQNQLLYKKEIYCNDLYYSDLGISRLESGHKCHGLIMKDKDTGTFCKITTSSIESNLSESEVYPPKTDVPPSDRDIRNLELFMPQYKGGIKYLGKSEDDFILLGYIDKDRDNTEKVDIITSKGEKLFELRHEQNMNIISVTQSGLLIVEKFDLDNMAYYGIIDKHGKVLLPCMYGKHAYKSGFRGSYDLHELLYGIYEVQPGIMTFTNRSSYINVYNGDCYKQVIGDYGLRMSEENSHKTDIVCLKDNRIIKKDVFLAETVLNDLGKGWYGVKVIERSACGFGVDELYMLFNKDSVFTLKRGECVLKHENHIYYVSDGRIVTKENEEINIRDYRGNMIKSIKSNRVDLMCPYKFQKLLAFKKEKSILIYYDAFGNEHEIPYPIIYSVCDFEAYFVSESVLLIRCERYSKHILINIEGKELFKNNEPIEPLSEKYLLFRSFKKFGIIDNYGKVFIGPHFSGIEVIV